jgi:lipoprotein signal peptidase
MDERPATTVSDRPSDHRPAIGHIASHLRFWIVAVAILALDLWSKQWIFTNLGPREERSFLPGVIAFHRSLNDGAVFGSFTGYVGLFIVASLFALGFVFYLFAVSPRTHRAMHVSLALILAGALGNLYDRARMEADVILLTTRSGEPTRIIGKILSEPDENHIVVGDWPDGTNPQTFSKDEVTYRRQGVVRDFIQFLPRFPDWVPRLRGRMIWPWVFNIADAALVCGVGALLFTSWLRHDRSDESS